MNVHLPFYVETHYDNTMNYRAEYNVINIFRVSHILQITLIRLIFEVINVHDFIVFNPNLKIFSPPGRNLKKYE